jgi:hypothetical protein
MPARPRSAASVIKYRKAAFIAAAIGTAAALITCALLGMGRTAYESQAVLSYSPDSLSTAEVSMLSAETVAAKALDDAHLVSILDGFGLYPEMRQGASQTAALDRLRSNISLRQDYVSQKGQVDLHLVYRDESPLKGPSVANALANSPGHRRRPRQCLPLQFLPRLSRHLLPCRRPFFRRPCLQPGVGIWPA